MSVLDRLRGRPSVPFAEARAAAENGVAIYWRPGCPFCLTLRVGLAGQGGKASWVNIWRDPDAAAYVRSVNGGDETVPTVVIDGEPHTNPPPGLVRAALRSRAR
ncbi:glutaredoxin domain-containing protein [Nocardioides donggukensis]|uniref:NrdH-redoxin n=1 Tax=Nocardioides donggukensis TaxID=2774019 RepID=A0A927K600_9ACTN|nr:glutaredoxin domain-containing protein [Nocardioides donggukensis]MBD8870561.1 NrdH-redoxin [Nocardioides donggukensis]